MSSFEGLLNRLKTNAVKMHQDPPKAKQGTATVKGAEKVT